MGERQNGPFQLSFNSSLKVDFQGSRVTSDSGLILVRELDERLGFGDLVAQHLTDSRRGKNTQLPLADLLRQSVYSRIVGYEDVNDAERVSQDPTFRLIGSEKTWDRGAALTSRLQTFETEMLAEEDNFRSLARINRELIAKAEAIDTPQRIVLDMDSTEIPVYGQQENSAYNGHFESTCYHPLLLFNREGDCLAAKLRPGNVHSAEGWEELLLPEIERQQTLGKEVVFRADAAFAKPEIYEALEERGVKYAIRIPSNDSLERDIEELLTRPVGRPSHKPVIWYKSLLYQAASWRIPRRVVAKVEFHAGELFPRVGFIVTNLEADSRAVVRFYNKRGTAEQWIKEGKQAVKMTRLSCHRFRSNEVRLWLSLIAYNLGNLWRRLVLPKRIEGWSLTSLQQRLVKTGGRLIKHARYYWLLLAESQLTRRLFGSMVRRIASLPQPAGYTEEMPLLGRQPYEVSKSCADLISQAYFHTYRLPVAQARCGNVYGGGDLNWSRIVPGTIRSLLRGESPVLRSDGKSIRDYIYVKDVSSAYLCLAEGLSAPEIRGQSFNFSPESQVTVLEIVNMLRRLAQREHIQPTILNSAKGEIRNQYLSSAKAERLLHWKPAYDLERGLAETIRWYQDFFGGQPK